MGFVQLICQWVTFRLEVLAWADVLLVRVSVGGKTLILSRERWKSQVMVLNGENVLECQLHVEGIRLEHVSEFKYLGCVLNESDTNGAECSRVTSGMRVAGTIRSLVNPRDLQL